ncbi:unnamed protein product [Symbiodinium sp. CCMP2592]|nr:unnamed protein product [Symbiodinium sp. CCMP2592]
MAPKSALPKTGAKAGPKKRAQSQGRAPALPTEDIKRFKSFVQAEAKRGARKNDQTDSLAEAYDQSDREGKREILEKWSNDRSLGWVAGYLREKAFVHSQGCETRSSWQTEAAICAQEGLGNLEHISEDNRKVLDELLKDYEVREHEIPTLAALGMKQYRTKKTEATEQDSVRLTLSATGVDKPEKASSSGSRNKGKNSNTTPVPGGAPGEVVINYTVLCEKTKKEVTKLLTLVRKDAADNAEDSLENVTFDEPGLEGLRKLLATLQESHEAFLALLAKCCPKALPKAKAKAKAEAKPDDSAEPGTPADPPAAPAPAAPAAANAEDK